MISQEEYEELMTTLDALVIELREHYDERSISDSNAYYRKGRILNEAINKIEKRIKTIPWPTRIDYIVARVNRSSQETQVL